MLNRGKGPNRRSFIIMDTTTTTTTTDELRSMLRLVCCREKGVMEMIAWLRADLPADETPPTAAIEHYLKFASPSAEFIPMRGGF